MSSPAPSLPRILAIAPTSFFADYGCHVRIRGQLTELSARGHQVRLVTYPSGRDVDDIETIRARWLLHPSIQVGSSRLKLVLDALLAPTALAAALRFRPDIIHAYLHEGALIGAVLAKILHRPLVFDFQGSLTSEMLDHGFINARSPLLGPLRRLETWIDHRPEAILASSAHAVELLVEKFGVPRDRVSALPDSADPSHFRPASAFDANELAALRANLAIPPAHKLIVYLGLLAPYQGTDLLLEAMAQLARRQTDTHLLLMGFPFVDHYRAEVIRLGLAHRVTLTGPISYEDAPRYLALGDVAVAPKLSETEGSGKLLTYMATALPVVAFDTPVHREYLGNLGIYAAHGDTAGLAEAIVQTLEDTRAGAQRGAALRDRAERLYPWSLAGDKIADVHARLVRRPPHAL